MFAILVGAAVAAADSIPSFVFALPGFDALRNSDFQRAVADIQADTTFADTGVKLFKLGVAYARASNVQQALFCFRLSAQKDERIAPLAYERIGDLCASQHQVENALHAYRAALTPNVPARFAAALREKMYGVLKADSTLAAQISWFTEEKTSAPIADDAWVPRFLDTLLAAGRWALADSIARPYLDTSGKSDRCRVCGMMRQRRFPDSLLSTRRLFELARIGLDCKLFDAAKSWHGAAMERADFGDSVSEREHFRLAGMLAYQTGNYPDALKWLDKHEKKFGLTPEIVMTIARCYRRQNKMVKSDIWYDKLLELYPRHAQASEVLWYRAWRKEEDGHYEDAIRRYLSIQQRYPRAAKGDQALYRAALCRYKRGTHTEAVAAFRAFGKRYPASGLATGASYWRARSLMALGKNGDAADLLRSICAAAPWDYYAFRSVEALVTMGDTSGGLVFDSTVTIARARVWLDSINAGKPLSSADSLLWFRGALVALSGSTEQAELFLQPLESKYPANLALQFDLAVLYDMCEDPTLSFRVSRRFAWRIAEKYRARLPLTVYGMMYPLPFEDLVVESALREKVDPLLVCAVMRQESIFNPRIVSPVGAVGLMQIMPYTGASIAASLQEMFAVDTLYQPAVNIRYGAWYLRQLLDQFDGDIASAAAAYNGGPDNVTQWRAHSRPPGTEMLVENLGFHETREYVKKVLGNYWTYKKLAPALGYPGS